MRITRWADRTIVWGFHLLFFLVPLVLTPWNYELFEYNKMMLTYVLTVVIVGAWAIKWLTNATQPFLRTPFDIPIALFVISQLLSTFFSIDRHVSLWGYYSRFNGGLVSIFSYVLLYYAFVNNFRREQIKPLLTTILTSGTLVSIYGIAEHFGIDKHLWVQDVQNRVFSTLGQPNWLAAYLAVLIPVSLGLSIYDRKSSFWQASSERVASNATATFDGGVQNLKEDSFRSRTSRDDKISRASGGTGQYIPSDFGFRIPYVLLTILLYVTLIFTKSRSGFLGTWVAFAVLGSILFINYKKSILKPLSIFLFSFIFLHFIYDTPFAPLNRFTFSQLTARQATTLPTEASVADAGSTENNQLLTVGVTESGEIRKVVWKGAMDIIRHYPILGSGVETFAFSYYQFRPVEHNMTSEWDFLYNKAHNEYLNYAATTGILGLGTYLLFIGNVIWWCLRNIRKSSFWQASSERVASNATATFDGGVQNLKEDSFRSRTSRDDKKFLILTVSLFAGWLSILVTNFFGFSVVIVQLFFFLIPAFLFVLTRSEQTPYTMHDGTTTWKQKVLITIIALVTLSLLWKIGRTWHADTVFAEGYHASRSGEYTQAYTALSKAIRINQREPFYFDELAIAASQLAAAIDPQTEATLSAELQQQAIAASDVATVMSPNNVNYWKTRTRVLYTFSQLDELYLPATLSAIEKAKSLSPTDPKIRYNLALVYNNLEKHQEAYRELEEAIQLKPNYKEPVFALALFYQRDNQPDKAKEQLNYLLTRIDPTDAEAKTMLEELK